METAISEIKIILNGFDHKLDTAEKKTFREFQETAVDTMAS